MTDFLERTSVAAVLVVLACITTSQAWPKINSGGNGFIPIKNYLPEKDQVAMESSPFNTTLTPAASDKAGRFGFPTYTTDANNYPQNVNNVLPGLYGPVKLDIGGLVLGTIVGLGAFFILPKIFHVISGPYGGYKRSEDVPEGSGLNEIARRVSDGIESMNLDTTACLQRALCTSLQTPAIASPLMEPLAKNVMVKSLLGGSDWEKAVNVGSSGESCGSAFPKCPFTVDSVVKPLVKFLSAVGAS